MKAGFLGHGRQARLLLHALRSLDEIELLAVGGLPSEPDFNQELPVPTQVYQDYRSLIVEQPIEVLFVAGHVPSLMDYLALAAANGVRVWRTAAPSRSLEQLVRVMDVFDRADVPFEVARSWLHHPTYVATSEARASIGELFLGRGAMWAAAQSVNASITAGPFDLQGLLNSAYDLIDALIRHFGVPQAVFANACDSDRLNSTGTADTADTAIIALRYAHGPSATVSISQAVSRRGQLFRIDGRNGAFAMNEQFAVVCSKAGTILTRKKVESVNPYVHQVQELLTGPDDPERLTRSSGRSHVMTTAVIEAAALSARTGEAESPNRLVEIQGAGRYAVAVSSLTNPRHANPVLPPDR